MNINKRAGFTLVEMLLAMVLIIILVTLGTQTLLLTENNYRHIYYSAYSNLKHAAGEIVAASPDGKIPTATFCTDLADNFNILTDSGTCTYTYDFSPSRTFAYSSPNLNLPSFTLSNGQRFYVGTAFVEVGAENYFDSEAIMVAIDLNGTASPGILDTRVYTGGKTPDVVAFSILENGTVLPMSPMADRNNYITAKVQSCSKATGCDPSLPSASILYNNISIRQALSVAGAFPAKGGDSTLPVQYNTDTLYSFKTSYAVHSDCDPSSATTFCRILINDPLLGGIGSML